jgi:hypothetical protein
VENDAILFGSKVVIDGNVDGDVLAIGENVTINGGVSGSLVVIGQTVVINGQVDGTVYAGAVIMDLGQEAALHRNMYYAGVSMVASPGSTIGRDLYAVALGAQFGGTIGREVKAIIGPVEIIRIIVNWVNELRTGPSTIPQPTPTPRSLTPTPEGIALASLLWLAISNNVDARPLNPFQAQDINKQNQGLSPQAQVVVDWLLARLRDFVTLFVVGVLGIWLLPKKFDLWSGSVRTKPLPALGYGFILLITGFVGVVILFALLLGIGFALGFITLWDLAFIVFFVGSASLSLGFSIFLLLVFYVSKVIVAYLFGHLILERLLPKAAVYRIWPLLLGLFLYVLVRAIPYFVGSLVAFAATLFGLGAFWLVYIDSRTPVGQAQPEALVTSGEDT